MRKFITALVLDPATFEPKMTIRLKNSDGTLEVFPPATLKAWKSKYTPEQREEIDAVNTILADKELPQLTDEEIDYMLKLGKHSLHLELPEEPEDLQALAGFKVEKKIIYTDNKD